MAMCTCNYTCRGGFPPLAMLSLKNRSSLNSNYMYMYYTLIVILILSHDQNHMH